MAGYVKLFSDIVDSSIWDEDPYTCKVWVTLLALADPDGFVRGSAGWLAGKSRVSTEQCERALQKLRMPDPRSRTPEYEGRRVEFLDDGWLILNYHLFRDRLSNDPQTTSTRERVRKHRERYRALRNVTSVTPEISASASASVPVSVPEGGQGGIQMKATDNRNASITDGVSAFERFWQAYPKKVKRGDAEHAFVEVRGLPLLQQMLDAISAQRHSEQWLGGYIPDPGNWLRDKRWLDQPTEQVPEKEQFGVPGSKRFRVQYVGGKERYYTRTDGGPKREHFARGAAMDDTFDGYRVAYLGWLKDCEEYEAQHAKQSRPITG